MFSRLSTSLFKNHKIDEKEYFRNLAIELNNIAVDLYTNDDMYSATRMYQKAIKAMMTSFQQNKHGTVTIKDAKNIFLDHIVEGKERLFRMTTSSSKKNFSKDGLDSYQWSHSSSGMGLQFISEPIKITCNKHGGQDKEQYFIAAVMMHNVALIHIMKREFDAAEDILDSAIEYKSALDKIHEDKPNLFIFATILNNLGYIQHINHNSYAARGIFAKALDVGNQILIQTAIRNDHSTNKNENTRIKKHVGTIIFNIAVLHSCLRPDYEKIKEACEYSLELQRMALGNTHPDIAIIEHKIGMVYLEIGRVNEAERCFLESLRLSRVIHDNENVAKQLFHLGYIHALKGDNDRALHAYQETVTIHKISLSENQHLSLITTCEIAKIYQLRGELNKALSTFNEALVIAEKISGTLSKQVASILCKICKIHIERGEIHEAIELKRKIERKIKYLNKMNIHIDYIEFAQIGHLLENPPPAGAA